MATNAQHQSAFRARQASAGNIRIDSYISSDAHAVLTTLAKQHNLEISAVLEAAIFTIFSTTLRKEDTSMKPDRPQELTTAEFLELQTLKEELPNRLISLEFDQRAIAFNGGASGIAQKESINAMLNSYNVHRK